MLKRKANRKRKNTKKKVGHTSWITPRLVGGVLAVGLGLVFGGLYTRELLERDVRGGEKLVVLGVLDDQNDEGSRVIEERVKYWQRVVELQPKYSEGYRRLAGYEAARGNFNAAAGYAARALELDPGIGLHVE